MNLTFSADCYLLPPSSSFNQLQIGTKFTYTTPSAERENLNNKLFATALQLQFICTINYPSNVTLKLNKSIIHGHCLLECFKCRSIVNNNLNRATHHGSQGKLESRFTSYLVDNFGSCKPKKLVRADRICS